MKNTASRIVALISASLLLATFIAACSDVTDDDSDTPPEFMYVMEIMPLPSDIGTVDHLAYLSGKLFLTSRTTQSDQQTGAFYTSTRIYSMNIDGTGLTEIAGYAPLSQPPTDGYGAYAITDLRTDDDGNLWVCENWAYYGYDLPADYAPERDLLQDYAVAVDEGSAVRKLDASGNELLSFDLSGLFNSEGTYAAEINIDGSGNIYLALTDGSFGGSAIYALDNIGNVHFSPDFDGDFLGFIRLADGSMALHSGSSKIRSFQMPSVLTKIDFEAKTLGEVIKLPDIGDAIYEIYQGGNLFDVILIDRVNVYGFTIGAEQPEFLFNMIESGIIGSGLRNFIVLPDDRILCTNLVFNMTTYDTDSEILVLTKTPRSEIPEKTTLTLATFSVDTVRTAVAQFNRSSRDYRIEVWDYNHDRNLYSGLTRLSVEINAGNVPDILHLPRQEFRQYLSSGLFEDLYPFLDADADISRGDIVESVLRASEVGGKLYSVSPSFFIDTIIGHPSVVGADQGWNMEEFGAVLDAHPDADCPLGAWLMRANFLQTAVSLDLDSFIDRGTGAAYFDSAEFIQLLETAGTFPAFYSLSDVSEAELVATGRQIMFQGRITNYSMLRTYKMLFGGDFVYKGFPTEGRDGSSLHFNTNFSIAASSEHKGAAWEFLRMFYDADWQIANTSYGFPTNKEAFDAQLRRAMEDGGYQNPFYDSPDASDVAISQTDADRFLSVVGSVSANSWELDEALWNIINECSMDYFNGRITAEEAARLTQSRAAIWASEQG